jgi:hypothetical protein
MSEGLRINMNNLARGNASPHLLDNIDSPGVTTNPPQRFEAMKIAEKSGLATAAQKLESP